MIRLAAAAAVVLATIAATPGPVDRLGLPRPTPLNTSRGANTVRAASDAYARGDFARAERLLRAALHQPGDVGTATFDLGMLEYRRGDHRAGERDMNRGIALAGNGDLGVARAALVKVRDALLAQERSATHAGR